MLPFLTGPVGGRKFVDLLEIIQSRAGSILLCGFDKLRQLLQFLARPGPQPGNVERYAAGRVRVHQIQHLIDIRPGGASTAGPAVHHDLAPANAVIGAERFGPVFGTKEGFPGDGNLPVPDTRGPAAGKHDDAASEQGQPRDHDDDRPGLKREIDDRAEFAQYGGGAAVIEAKHRENRTDDDPGNCGPRAGRNVQLHRQPVRVATRPHCWDALSPPKKYHASPSVVCVCFSGALPLSSP